MNATAGSVTIPIHRCTWRRKAAPGRKARVYVKHVATWRDAAGVRHREAHADPAAAKARALEIATSIANGETSMLSFTQADRAAWLRCQQLARDAGAPVELLVAEAAECRKILAQHSASAPEACRAWLAAHPAGVQEKFAPEIVTEYSSKHPACSKWERNRKLILERFARQFPGPLTLLCAKDLDAWLDNLAVGLRTRRNYRDALSSLLAYARHRRYLSQEADPLEGVSDPEPKAVEFDLYSPEDLARLLALAERTESGRKLVPLICITAWAGVRHGEMREEKARLLDWSDLDWDTKRIHVDGRSAKTGAARIVDMPDNLLEWLQPYRRPAGRICELANSHDALCKLRARAGLTGKRRNALRKSFITYRLALVRNIAEVADQAGNSPAIIRQHYNAPATRNRELAARWFAIKPVRADVLPLWQHASSLAGARA